MASFIINLYWHIGPKNITRKAKIPSKIRTSLLGKRFLEFNKIWCQETLILGPITHGHPQPFIRAFIYFENCCYYMSLDIWILDIVDSGYIHGHCMIFCCCLSLTLKQKLCMNNNLWTCKLFIWWSMTSKVTFLSICQLYFISLLFKLFSYQNFILMLLL